MAGAGVAVNERGMLAPPLDLSIVMTVHDREPELLLCTLRSLAMTGLADAQVVIVNDRSTLDYGWLQTYSRDRLPHVEWHSTGEYDGWRVGGSATGYGNPARAFNVGLLAATRSTVLFMSSDVLLTTRVASALATRHAVPWTPRVLDLDSGREYCGASRFFPMPWALAVPRELALAVGGWDETYLGGLCYEDNDFVGRCGLAAGRILADWSATVYHQSHFQPAYVGDDADVRAANERNREWTRRKWGGVPFDNESSPMDINRRPDPSGLAALTFHGKQLVRTVEMTTGLVKDATPAPVVADGAGA